MYDKWFVQPIPPANTKVGLPLSDATKNAWNNPERQADGRVRGASSDNVAGASVAVARPCCESAATVHPRRAFSDR